ncbi:hypothetical protein GMRT_11985 [Giardia muris]|uniref:Uncharacterized protein n=1 Tax=Giardia muris TaxID=5742 RepID=A0A4Z1T3I6_GIAMU|nr:hypothetical protein GMRT_11985 [Giardia muris]|eukprot:TNJ27617.1 hypothetical protein GMRT_11985 [Giardia muris]
MSAPRPPRSRSGGRSATESRLLDSVLSLLEDEPPPPGPLRPSSAGRPRHSYYVDGYGDIQLTGRRARSSANTSLQQTSGSFGETTRKRRSQHAAALPTVALRSVQPPKYTKFLRAHHAVPGDLYGVSTTSTNPKPITSTKRPRSQGHSTTSLDEGSTLSTDEAGVSFSSAANNGATAALMGVRPVRPRPVEVSHLLRRESTMEARSPDELCRDRSPRRTSDSDADPALVVARHHDYLPAPRTSLQKEEEEIEDEGPGPFDEPTLWIRERLPRPQPLDAPSDRSCSLLGQSPEIQKVQREPLSKPRKEMTTETRVPDTVVEPEVEADAEVEAKPEKLSLPRTAEDAAALRDEYLNLGARLARLANRRVYSTSAISDLSSFVADPNSDTAYLEGELGAAREKLDEIEVELEEVLARRAAVRAAFEAAGIPLQVACMDARQARSSRIDLALQMELGANPQTPSVETADSPLDDTFKLSRLIDERPTPPTRIQAQVQTEPPAPAPAPKKLSDVRAEVARTLRQGEGLEEAKGLDLLSLLLVGLSLEYSTDATTDVVLKLQRLLTETNDEIEEKTLSSALPLPKDGPLVLSLIRGAAIMIGGGTALPFLTALAQIVHSVEIEALRLWETRIAFVLDEIRTILVARGEFSRDTVWRASLCSGLSWAISRLALHCKKAPESEQQAVAALFELEARLPNEKNASDRCSIRKAAGQGK